MSIGKWAGIAVMFALAACASAPQSNDRDDWQFLGERTVNHAQDHDEIVITRSEGDFKRIALRVKGAPVEFDRVTVHFKNGEDQIVDMRDEIGAGGESRAIDLEGHERVIERVTFNYRTDERSGPRAVVQLWGLS
jgi:hypothetical protein